MLSLQGTSPFQSFTGFNNHKSLKYPIHLSQISDKVYQPPKFGSNSITNNFHLNVNVLLFLKTFIQHMLYMVQIQQPCQLISCVSRCTIQACKVKQKNSNHLGAFSSRLRVLIELSLPRHGELKRPLYAMQLKTKTFTIQ